MGSRCFRGIAKLLRGRVSLHTVPQSAVNPCGAVLATRSRRSEERQRNGSWRLPWATVRFATMVPRQAWGPGSSTLHLKSSHFLSVILGPSYCLLLRLLLSEKTLPRGVGPFSFSLRLLSKTQLSILPLDALLAAGQLSFYII
ncbi:hypothetical protein PMIN01_03864 [Paraphaeosphaeria minitans]|uniref:Uncharacterized protein n=1 Tax=Paraphaeosphaeria minitans TaxID=565426 RepID=A0A9P6KU39_9PLEO|nr:hypothetical protein PMIN01_03864 [Paraphaeosphaeria minitans]